ncbi:MAG TPA: hypothetical protein VJB87_01550 [Candidatus Nanoarchaeia archaeon]|nr:hypothetical protein [Candidatus Nanoarchaeia archaeon]
MSNFDFEKNGDRPPLKVLEHLLETARTMGSSDLHLAAGTVPKFRMGEELVDHPSVILVYDKRNAYK